MTLFREVNIQKCIVVGNECEWIFTPFYKWFFKKSLAWYSSSSRLSSSISLQSPFVFFFHLYLTRDCMYAWVANDRVVKGVVSLSWGNLCGWNISSRTIFGGCTQCIIPSCMCTHRTESIVEYCYTKPERSVSMFSCCRLICFNRERELCRL